ncbi:MAG: SpoIIE family protein phosphatase [Treponema sp.]|nr:SpoIIE family protein phosphatase [Candidatus Treponema equifaecale]
MRTETGNIKVFFLILILGLGMLFAQSSSLDLNVVQKENFFWDNVKDISKKESYFPITLSDGRQSYVFYESADKASKSIKISYATSENFQKGTQIKSLPGRFAYSGDEVPNMYSAAISKNGIIAISVLDASSEKGTLRIYASENSGESFEEFSFGQQGKQIVSSRIYSSTNGGFVLFVSVGEGKQSLTDSSFSLLYSESQDGKKWNELSKFRPADGISNAFSPFLAQINGRDLVFFEGWLGKDPSSSQIYCSSRSGMGWSSAKIVTDDAAVPSSEGQSYENYKNFRPNVLSDGNETKIAWERTPKNSATATVMVAPLNADGFISDRNDVEALNQYGNGRRPSLFKYHGKFFISWFDDRNGVNNVYLYENLGVQWSEVDSITRRQNKTTASLFCCPVITIGEGGKEQLSLIWQQTRNSENSICILEEDFYAEKPTFTPRNFTVGKHGKNRTATVRVNMPKDVSEILGFVAVAGTNSDIVPAKDELSESFRKPEDNLISAAIDDDVSGDQKIYFKARVLDKAGNWSEVAEIEYYYDVTPPKAPENIFYDKDNFGFASTNDVAFKWENPADNEEISGYSWSLESLAKLDRKYAVSKTKKLTLTEEECNADMEKIIVANYDKALNAKLPSSKVQGTKLETGYRNRSNGLYLFTVCAIDSVGNVSEPASVFVFLNKFRAATQIKNVQTTVDDYGAVTIGISGDEFEYDGTISQVIITNQSGGEKYQFNKDQDYKVSSSASGSSKISAIKIDEMKPGKYTVQIRHSERGLSTWSKALVINEGGTVKYERNYNFEPQWKILDVKNFRYKVDSERLTFWCLLVLISLGVLGSARGLVVTVRETVKIRKEVQSILTGDIMAIQTKERLQAVKVKFSLKLKLGLFTTALLLLIVAGVAVSIGAQMSFTQEKILISGLKDRVKVVMGNMSSGVQTYLPDGREKLTELGSIVNQVDNFAEASYATILSYEIDGRKLSDGSSPIDYVWATNDADIGLKIASENYDEGTVRLKNFEIYQPICESVKVQAQQTVSAIGNDSSLIFEKLNSLSAQLYGSYPHLDDEKLSREQTEYIFYWPVLYQQGKEENYLHSVILLKVNTDTLIQQVDESRQVTFVIAALAAAVASVIGLICAIMLASVIVNPIKRVVEHVKTITETKDKEELDGFILNIKTRDELRTLGDSVNEMTEGLVKGARDEKRAKEESEKAAKAREDAARASAEAAKASEAAARAQAEESKARAEAAEMNIMNLDGQAVQKAFIPLVSDGPEKETTAQMQDKDIQMYGYYEGTDAVSGDYFDYKKLDDRWYAIIKCDASGHGVPAALIMTIVATIFRRYFATWSFKANGTKLNLLASDINDFIESLGLRGKFAAMMICLFDTKTGEVYMCNAGDNIVHYFDSADKKMKLLTLHESPAAGPLPSFMVEMKGGYKVEKFKLKKNDILFLYTDGIEESTRFFRDAKFDVTECREPGLKVDDIHETHKVGQTSEQMEPQRVQDIIEAALNKKKYVLKKWHNPIPTESLEFDFSKCGGTIQDAITALTAVEKIFRIYKRPGANGKITKTEMSLDGKSKTLIQVTGDGIKVDRKIDQFLEKCFNRYDFYCSQKVDMKEPNYVYYTGVNEDSQADDLTLLAIQKL